jgi:hypothetical protein
MKKTRVHAVVLFIVMLSMAGCSLFKPSPSQVVKNFFQYVEKGEVENATKLFSKQSAQTFGSKLPPMMSHQVSIIKSKGGIKSIDTQENITGDLAKVKYKVTYSDTTTEDGSFDLIKEDGDWKIQISMNK